MCLLHDAVPIRVAIRFVAYPDVEKFQQLSERKRNAARKTGHQSRKSDTAEVIAPAVPQDADNHTDTPCPVISARGCHPEAAHIDEQQKPAEPANPHIEDEIRAHIQTATEQCDNEGSDDRYQGSYPVRIIPIQRTFMSLHAFRRENPVDEHCLKRPTDKDSSDRHKEECQLGMR